jgi:hypothetical protein
VSTLRPMTSRDVAGIVQEVLRSKTQYLVGFASSGLFVSAITTVSELCPAAKRSTTLLLIPIFYSAGSAVSVLLAWATLGGVGAHGRFVPESSQ